MKMTKAHFAHLQQGLRPYDTDFHRDRYKAAGLSTTRYQWDMLCHAGLMGWLCNTLYTYLEDSHIQTALNKIVKPL
jgi:hypothetical protein